jgi:hypothetical protein
MAEYWLKPSADAQAEGPFTAAEVKRRVASGAVVRQTLISMDNVTFHPAGRVKGLFQSTSHASPAFTTSVATTDRPAATPPRRGGLPPTYPRGMRTVVRSVPVPPPSESPPENGEPATPLPPPMIEQGDGTIESQPSMPIPPAPPIAPPPLSPTPASASPRPSLPPALGYATPGVTGHGTIAARRTGTFFTIALLMLPVGLAHAYGFVINLSRRPSDVAILVTIGAALAWAVLSVAALLLWLFWLAGVHKDIRFLTAGHYEVSPAKAAGFFFIPIFNVFWVIFVPAKLAGAVNKQLQAAGEPPVSRGGVVACQVISAIAPFVGLYAITPLMYAMSMRMIQGGFNRLVARQYAR